MKLDSFRPASLTYKIFFNLKYLLSLFLLTFFLLTFFLSYSVNAKSSDNSLTKITLQLKWYHQFQFAGYYAAKEKGFYKDLGLDVEIHEGGPNLRVQDMVISGKIDAMNGSLANQPFLFGEKGIPVNLIRPINYGIDFYGDTLFTTQDKVKKNPKLILAFMNASFKGWKYAFSNPDELIDIIINKYHSLNSKDHLDFEQKQLRNLMHPDLVEIGHNNPERWGHIKETYQKLGMISPDFSLEGFLYKDYHPPFSVWINRLLMMLGFILIFSIVIFIYNFQLRKNVKKITREIQESREYLKITLSSIGDAVIAVDLAGNIVTMNPVAEKLTGWSLKDAFGLGLTTVLNIVHAKTGKSAENPVESVLKKGQVVGLANHTVLISKEGIEYQISDSGAPIKDAQGDILGVVMVF